MGKIQPDGCMREKKALLLRKDALFFMRSFGFYFDKNVAFIRLKGNNALLLVIPDRNWGAKKGKGFGCWTGVEPTLGARSAVSHEGSRTRELSGINGKERTNDYLRPRSQLDVLTAYWLQLQRPGRRPIEPKSKPHRQVSIAINFTVEEEKWHVGQV